MVLFPSLLGQPPRTLSYAAPAGQMYTTVVPGGRTILPNGRFLTPIGKRLYGGENCWNIVKGPGGRAVMLDEKGLVLFSSLGEEKVTSRRLARKEYGFAAQFFPGTTSLVISSGEAGGIEIIDFESGESQFSISANVNGSNGSYINDLVISKDGRYIYSVDVANQDLVTFDLTEKRLVSRVKAGRQPYSIALDSTGKHLFVANIGLFNYSKIPVTTNKDFFANGISRPAFAFPSKEAEEGVEFEGRRVPGLGSPYVPDAHSIFAYRLFEPNEPHLLKQAKTGLLIHAPTSSGKAVGGSAPCALLSSGGKIYVSNSNNDTVQELDGSSLRVLRTLSITPVEELRNFRGVIPNGLALAPDGKTLFVCESGINAVAAIDLKTWKIKYHLPTGWYPNALSVSDDGQSLYIACQKGIGRGPRGTKYARKPGDERFGLADMPGLLNVAPLPKSQTEMASLTEQVLANNGLIPTKQVSTENNPIPARPGVASKQIKYVVFITKENHTFDGIFGTLEGAKADPDGAEFGERGWLREKGNREERLPIMPNHLKLARQFSISDNFYMEPSASGDGHRWLIGVYPSVWTTKVFYSGWNFGTSNVGRMVSFGSNGSQIPEDYLENGSMWEHLERAGVSFRNYGEGFEFPGVDEAYETTKSGAIEVANFPINKALWNNTCWDFPIYNNNIPDIARFEWFKEDLEKNYRKKGKPLPRFMNITYCNDHGTRPRPKDGYPYTASFMADNDLALGRTIEYLSSLPEWKNMAVFVTQDDSGGDNDSVDRHRSFVMAYGPWVKKGYVSHDHTSIMSILKTIYQIFGAGPNNLFDATATDLRDMFTLTPDFTPYKSVESDPRVFVANKAYDPKNPEFRKRRFMKPTVALDDPAYIESLRRGNLANDDH